MRPYGYHRPRSGPSSVLAQLAVFATLGSLAATGCTTTPMPSPTASSPAVPTTGGVGTAAATPPAPTTASPVVAPTADGAPAAQLSRITVADVGFDSAVAARTTVQMGGAIDPPKYAPGRPSRPVWVSDKGVAPSATASDTTYVGCHTSATHGPEQYPCDVLVRSVKVGARVVVTTDAGPLTYTVTKTRSIPYGQFASDEETWRIEPKRLVFVVCDILDGTPTHANYVVYATL